VLKTFTGSPDAAEPAASLILSGNVLYGTTRNGGNSGQGTVFKINTDGTGYTLLHYFTNSLVYPYASLTLSGNVLYGTTMYGGSSASGSVFKINTDGTSYAVLKSFTDEPDGAEPAAGLTLSGNVLYGTTSGGGILGRGTVFKINTDGSGYIVLENFTNTLDGSLLQAGLTLSSNVLYGTTAQGGSSGSGTVFKINTDGTGYIVLENFTNSPDGAEPAAGLILSGNVLYGTTSAGGISGKGTVFKINIDGTSYAVLKSFTNSPDGANPQAGLTLSGNVLYGTTAQGGSSGLGTVFSLTIVLPGFNQISGQLLGDGDMQLFFEGFAGGNYALDRSFSLSPANWIPQVTNPADANGNLIFTNTPDPTTNNFWRIRSVP
jgi:uncharacterized repeat protein (TIGR03803 family)